MKPILKKLKKISCVSSNQFATGKRRRKKFERRIFSLTYILRQGCRNMRWNFKKFFPLLIYSRKDPKSDKNFWSARKKSLHLYNRVRTKKFNEIIKKVEKSKAGKNIKAVFLFCESVEIEPDNFIRRKMQRNREQSEWHIFRIWIYHERKWTAYWE